MKPATSPKTKRKPKSVARAATAQGFGRGAGRTKKKLDASGLAWLLNEELPPADQLPENPVLYLRRL